MASSTSFRVSSFTKALSCKTRDTVDFETFAIRAISMMVTLPLRDFGRAGFEDVVFLGDRVVPANSFCSFGLIYFQ